MIRTIWVIRLSSLGDLVLCEPAIAGIAATWPDARLTVVTRSRYFDLFRAHPQVHGLIDIGDAPERPAPDLAIDLHNRWDTRRIASRAERAIIWRKRGPRDLVRAALGKPLHRGYREGPHQTERIAAGLERHGIIAAARPPRVHLDSAWTAQITDERGVVLLPAAAHHVKAWPSHHFSTVARALIAQGRPVHVLVGPGEGPLAEEVARQAPGAVALSPDLGIGDAAATLARAHLVLGNDTGLLHLAAGVGTPVVGLFGPTSPGRWGPPPGRGVVVSSDPPCGPCSDYGARPCSQARRVCLEDLAPDMVTSAALLLSERLTQSQPVSR